MLVPGNLCMTCMQKESVVQTSSADKRTETPSTDSGV